MAWQNPSPLNLDSGKNFKRIVWIDYAKGIGIFLVVFGHVLRGLVSSSILQTSTLEQSVDQWIYAFHMPLFFFLSGLFIERSVAKPLNKFFVDKLQFIVYPYFLWSILQEFLRIVAGIRSEPIVTLWRIIYQPVMQFWFLYVLFFISLAYAIARKFRVSSNVFLLCCILLYAAHVVGINFGPWGVIYMIRQNAIYFAVGAFVGERKLLLYLEHATPFALISTAIGGFVVIALVVAFNLVEVKVIVPAIALVGIAASISIAKYLEEVKLAEFLKNWGLLSLQIYVVHTIASAIMRVILQRIFNLSDPAIHILAGTTIGIYGPVILYMICQKIRLPYVFTLRRTPDRSKS